MKKVSGMSQQFYKKVNLFFDNELPVREKEQFIETIKKNPDKEAFFKSEISFRRLLKSRLKEEKPSNSLILKIKESIKKEK